MHPTVSIIVPIYKVEKYLRKCIDSILSQSFCDFELILVDDGSPDNCPKLCDEYALKDERIRVIHKENGGLSDARNAGIKIAQGKYIGFVDSDDYIAPDMYKTLYELAEKHTADIAVCDAVLVSEDQEAAFTDSESIQVFNKEQALVANIYERKINVNAWNKLYRRELFAKIRYPKGMLYEDLATTYKLIDLSQKVVYTKAKKYAYLQRSGSIMNQTSYKMKADKVVIANEITSYFKGRGNEEILFAGVINYLLNDVYKMASNGNLTECIDYLKELKNFTKKEKATLKENRYLSFKDKKILALASKQSRLLQFLYFNVRGNKGKR